MTKLFVVVAIAIFFAFQVSGTSAKNISLPSALERSKAARKVSATAASKALPAASKPSPVLRRNYTLHRWKHHSKNNRDYRRHRSAHAPNAGGEEEGGEWNAVASAAFLSLSFLAAVTILFEKGKEVVVEHASRSLRPIVTSLFSELTVLGFLGLITFLVSKTNLLQTLSIHLFCDGNSCWHVCKHEERPLLCVNEKKAKLQELFETIHMTLFLVMILFIMLGLANLKISIRTFKQWKYWDDTCMSSFDKVRHSYHHHGALIPKSQMVFSSIRSVFVANPDKPAQALNYDFPFALYLYEVLGVEVAEITEVPVSSWLFLEFILIVWYCIIEAVEGNMDALTWIWIVFAWTLVLFSHLLEGKLSSICEQCAVAEDVEEGKAVDADSEDTHLLEEGAGWDSPGTRQPQYETSTPRPNNWFVAFWVGNHSLPSRHEMLFWFRQKGTDFHVFLLRQLMLGMSIYLAVFTMLYAQRLWEETNELGVFGILGVIVELSVAYAPPVVFLMKVPLIVRLHVESCSIGSFRHHHKDTLKNVLRRQRTEKALRIMKVLSNARKLNMKEKNKRKKSSQDARRPSVLQRNAQFNSTPGQSAALKRQLADAEQAWAVVDADNSGSIDPVEMKLLMQSIGQTCGKEDVENMMQILDLDGDGTVSKEEFIQWIIAQNDGSEPTIDELCENLFAIFDSDGSGSISVEEFISKMQDFGGNDLSVDDIAIIARELDEDQSGSISVEEFRELIEKHSEDFAHH